MPRQWAACFRDFAFAFFALALTALLAGCATRDVTKATGRVTDPPVELVFYCLFFPKDPACRSIIR